MTVLVHDDPRCRLGLALGGSPGLRMGNDGATKNSGCALKRTWGFEAAEAATTGQNTDLISQKEASRTTKRTTRTSKKKMTLTPAGGVRAQGVSGVKLSGALAEIAVPKLRLLWQHEAAHAVAE